MLSSITEQQKLQGLKQKLFEFQNCLNNAKQQINPFLSFILCILSFIPTTCIVFKISPFYPNQINMFFTYFILSDLNNKLGISLIIIVSAYFIYMIALIICAFITYHNQKSNAFFTKSLYNLLNLGTFFVVPISELGISLIKNQFQTELNYMVQVFAAITLLLYFILCCLFLKFNIKPLRKKNMYWNFNNDDQLYTFILNVLRSLVYTIDGVNFASLIINLAIQILKSYICKKHHSKRYLIKSQVSSNMLISVYFGAITYFVTDDSKLSLKISLILILLSLFKSIYQFIGLGSIPLQLPLCQQVPFNFYQFYFQLEEKYSEKSSSLDSNQDLSVSIFNNHSRKCTNLACPLKTIQNIQNNILESSEQIVTKIFQNIQIQDPWTEVLIELWKFQRGKKFSFRKTHANWAISLQYVIFVLSSNQVVESHQMVNQNNASIYNKMFFQNLYGVLKTYSLFYEQILKPSPKIETIVSRGQQIRQQVNQIHLIYSEMLKRKFITFRGIQIFLAFESYFLKTSSLNPDLYKKITTIQRNKQMDEIEQIYLPALSVYPDTLLIENVNMQCISLLKMARFQIKTKLISDIIFPSIKFQQYYDFSQQQRQNTLTFIKKNTNQCVCGHITINAKYISNKKLHYYVFQKQKKQGANNHILINQDFNIVEIISKTQMLKDKKNHKTLIQIDWVDIFRNIVKPNQQIIKNKRFIKLDLPNIECAIMITLFQTYNKAYQILNLKIIKKISQQVLDRRQATFMNSIDFPHNIDKKFQSFQFYYDLNQENACLVGIPKHNQTNQLQKYRQSKAFQFFVSKMKSNLVKFTMKTRTGDVREIKTYRLVDHQLYNIDLQDKQAYVNEFNNLHVSKPKQQNKSNSSSNLYIFSFVIFIAIVLTVLSSILYLKFNSQMSVAKIQILTVYEIDRFKLNFYRIIAILRDVANQMYSNVGRNWINDLMNSYNFITSNKNEKMFSNEQRTFQFLHQKYNGNLNQLIEVILANVYTLTTNLIGETLQGIHNTTNMELAEMIQNEQAEISLNFTNKFQNLSDYKNVLFIGIFIGTSIFYVLMVCLCLNLVKLIREDINSLMMISDRQARSKQQSADKLMFVIDMALKNFQIDIKSISAQHHDYKPRKTQKRVTVGLFMKIIAFGMTAFFFLVNISIVYLYNQIIQSNFSDLTRMTYQAKNIIGAYSQLCVETNRIDHTEIIILQNILKLRNKLNEVINSADVLAFSQDTNDAVLDYYFRNSCSRINSNGYFQNQTTLSCQNPIPECSIQNPYNLGLSYVLSRMHYQMIDNLTDTFYMTGLYSDSFGKIFSQLSFSISNDVNQQLNQFITDCQLWSIILIVIDICYCAAAVFFSLYVKKKAQSVEKLIKFLDTRKNLLQNQTTQSSNQDDSR